MAVAKSKIILLYLRFCSFPSINFDLFQLCRTTQNYTNVTFWRFWRLFGVFEEKNKDFMWTQTLIGNLLSIVKFLSQTTKLASKCVNQKIVHSCTLLRKNCDHLGYKHRTNMWSSIDAEIYNYCFAWNIVGSGFYC